MMDAHQYAPASAADDKFSPSMGLLNYQWSDSLLQAELQELELVRTLPGICLPTCPVPLGVAFHSGVRRPYHRDGILPRCFFLLPCSRAFTWHCRRH